LTRFASAITFIVLGTLLGTTLNSSSKNDELALIKKEIGFLRNEIAVKNTTVTGTAGKRDVALVEQIKSELQIEMGLLSLATMKESRASFVELYSYDNRGSSSYGTASYIGKGYFLTVKHAVVALGQSGITDPRKITSVKVAYNGKLLNARVIDIGNSTAEVEPDDWAIIKVKESINLTELKINLNFGFEFADPIYRIGNDYSKGMLIATGYIGQRTANRLVTCLTDGHPGVSGGGVLNRKGELVGMPIGRMQSDFRFSFILPLKKEMFRKVPHLSRIE